MINRASRSMYMPVPYSTYVTILKAFSSQTQVYASHETLKFPF